MSSIIYQKRYPIISDYRSVHSKASNVCVCVCERENDPPNPDKCVWLDVIDHINAASTREHPEYKNAGIESNVFVNIHHHGQ